MRRMANLDLNCRNSDSPLETTTSIAVPDLRTEDSPGALPSDDAFRLIIGRTVSVRKSLDSI